MTLNVQIDTRKKSGNGRNGTLRAQTTSDESGTTEVKDAYVAAEERYGDISEEEGRESGGRERRYQEKTSNLKPVPDNIVIAQGAPSKTEGAFGVDKTGANSPLNARYSKDQKK